VASRSLEEFSHGLLVEVILPGFTGHLAALLGEDIVPWDPSWREASQVVRHHQHGGDEEDSRMVLFRASTLGALPVVVLHQEPLNYVVLLLVLRFRHVTSGRHRLRRHVGGGQVETMPPFLRSRISSSSSFSSCSS
jgi:hypothetical protein